MTPEEMQALIEAQEAKIAALETTSARVAELEARFAPPANDDDQFKPKTWKELNDRQGSIAEEAALKVLKEAEEKKEAIRKEEEDRNKAQNELIEKSLAKLQEEGLIVESKDRDDEGGKQRQQILGLTLRTGGTDVEASARMLKTAWEKGLEYDYESNSFRTAGHAPSPTRNAPVASSAARTPAPTTPGKVDLRGVGGDLDEAQRRFELAHPN